MESPLSPAITLDFTMHLPLELVKEVLSFLSWRDIRTLSYLSWEHRHFFQRERLLPFDLKPDISYMYYCRLLGRDIDLGDGVDIHNEVVKRGAQVVKVTLEYYETVENVSPLGGLHTVVIHECPNVVDVSGLSYVNTLTIRWCLGLEDVSPLGKKVEEERCNDSRPYKCT